MKQKVKFNMPPLGKQYAKQAIGKQQQIANNPVSKDEATQKITEVINKSKIPPSKLAEIGTLAENAINDPKQYQQFINYMVQNKLEKAEDLKKPDYQMLASMVVIGKVAQTMSDEQPVGKTTEPTMTEPTEQTMPVEGPVAPEGM